MAPKSKEEVEREKLEIELKMYSQRLDAEYKKTSLKVDKLERDARSQYQWVKSVGLIAFGVGIFVQSRSDTEKGRTFNRTASPDPNCEHPTPSN